MTESKKLYRRSNQRRSNRHPLISSTLHLPAIPIGTILPRTRSTGNGSKLHAHYERMPNVHEHRNHHRRRIQRTRKNPADIHLRHPLHRPQNPAIHLAIHLHGPRRSMVEHVHQQHPKRSHPPKLLLPNRLPKTINQYTPDKKSQSI